MKHIMEIFSSFFKIGVIGFGGGSALIPVVEKEVVEKKQWVSDDDYLKHTIIGNITPGGLPAKLGTLAGFERFGMGASLTAAYAVCIPGVFLTILIIGMLAVLGEGFTHYIEYASVGITIFIIYLLMAYIIKVYKMGIKEKKANIYLALILLAFLVTGGKELRQLTNGFESLQWFSDSLIWFDISTINLILVTFFMIFYAAMIDKKWAYYSGIAISILFSLVVGKNGYFASYASLKNIMLFMMTILSVYGLWMGRKGSAETENVSFSFSKKLLSTITVFILIPVVIGGVAVIMNPENAKSAINMLSDVAISTVTSFGGGEAYVGVADGVFVQGGYIAADIYYSQVVAISNALPGPILMKIASAIGYVYGNNIGGVAYGIVMGLGALAASIAACTPLALVVLAGYDALKDSKALKLLKMYILPVVCGMLLSTSLSMMVEALKVSQTVGIASIISLPLFIAWVLGYFYLFKKKHLNDGLVIVVTAALSLILFLVLSAIL